MHMDDAGSLTDRLSVVLLDLVNEAKDYVLETRNWDFDTRHDGIIVTKGVATDSATTVTNGLTAFTCAGGSPTPDASIDVAYLLISADAAQGDTAYRIVHANMGVGILDSAWLGTSAAANATSTIMYPIYKLPVTVKDVLSVRFQSDDLELKFVSRDETFNRVIPRFHDEISDDPRIVAVGSQVTTSYTTGGTPQVGTGVLIYPCPETSYRLDYSYTRRHPQLTDSQGLENVPDTIVHDIVLEAEALAYGSSVANDPDLEQRAHRLVELRTGRHHQVNTADPTRRTVLRSLDSKAGPSTWSRPDDPDVFYEP
jgi:hypothetical protein